MLCMTAAANVTARASSHPERAAGNAEPLAGLTTAGVLAAPLESAAQQQATAIPPVAHNLQRHTFSKGEALYHAGEEAATAFVIEACLVALTLANVSDRQRVVALAGPGDVVGALAPNPLHHSTGAVALSGEVVARVLPLAATDNDPAAPDQSRELAELLAAAAGDHIERLTWALEDSALPVPARLARALLRLGHRFGQHTANGAVRLTLPITHDTLAALVGAARETTTFTVQKLRNEGLLAGTRGRYQFDPEALAMYAHEAALAAR